MFVCSVCRSVLRADKLTRLLVQPRYGSVRSLHDGQVVAGIIHRDNSNCVRLQIHTTKSHTIVASSAPALEKKENRKYSYYRSI